MQRNQKNCEALSSSPPVGDLGIARLRIHEDLDDMLKNDMLTALQDSFGLVQAGLDYMEQSDDVDEYKLIVTRRGELAELILTGYNKVSIPDAPTKPRADVDAKIQEKIAEMDLAPCTTPDKMCSIATLHYRWS